LSRTTIALEYRDGVEITGDNSFMPWSCFTMTVILKDLLNLFSYHKKDLIHMLNNA